MDETIEGLADSLSQDEADPDEREKKKTLIKLQARAAIEADDDEEYRPREGRWVSYLLLIALVGGAVALLLVFT